MDNVSSILSVLLSLAMIAMFAPSVLRLNRGRALRNAALWIAIFLALGLAYRTIGPGATSPLPSFQEDAPKVETLEPRV